MYDSGLRSLLAVFLNLKGTQSNYRPESGFPGEGHISLQQILFFSDEGAGLLGLGVCSNSSVPEAFCQVLEGAGPRQEQEWSIT